jgi:hypothetical protein
MQIKIHQDNKTQSDFPGGAVDFCTTDPKEALSLGTQVGALKDYQWAQGSWGQGIFVRFPLLPHHKPQQEVPANLDVTTVDGCMGLIDLGGPGRKAMEVIATVLKRHHMCNTGGCRPFYTPREWKERGEQYGHDADLIVVYDGGDVSYAFNYDKGSFKLHNDMMRALELSGFAVEQCTHWYSAIQEA